jgi:hypothetical protein
VTAANSNITGVSVSPKSVSVPVNSTQQFSATVSGTGTVSQAVNWISSNVNVATVDADGLVTAKAAGNATITATSVADATKSDSASLTVTPTAPLTFNNYLQVVATVNQAIPTRTATVSGGQPPYTFSALNTLPSGLSLNPTTGAITGTPTATSAATNYTVQVSDSQTPKATATATINITVSSPTPPSLIYTTPKALTVGRAITGDNYGVTSGGLVGTPSYTVISGSLPGGLSLNPSNGTLSGAPTVPGTYALTVQATDSNAAIVSANLTLVVNAAPSVSTPYPALTATVGVTYTSPSNLPIISGGTAPLTFSGPGFPAGLSVVASSGLIAGTPTTPSPATNYTVTVTDANGAVVSTPVSIQVNPALVLTYTLLRPLTEGIGITSANYSRSVSGGAPPYTYSVQPGELPTGITLDASTGALSGSSSDTGSIETTITVTDKNGATANSSLTFIVNPPLNVLTDYTVPAPLKVGVAFTSSTPVLQANTGTAPFVYSVAPSPSPALPAGLSLNPTTGVISGTPTASSANRDYAIVVTDANGDTEALEINLQVDP